MPKKKKITVDINETTNSTGPLSFIPSFFENSKIEELKIEGGLTVTRDELNQVVAKINELIRKGN